MGGLEGALQRRASDLFAELDGDEQEATRQLFLRLVVVNDDGQRSRRRVAAREVASLAADVVTVQHAIARFGEHRLLSFDSDRLTGAPTVEVAHEALLTAWPRLDGWIDESRDDLRRHASLTTAVREWQLADEDPDYLLPAARVAEFTRWEPSSLVRLNEPELDFLAASAHRVAAQGAEEERRRRDEVRSRRRLWTLVGALAATLAVASLFLFAVIGGADKTTISFFGNRQDEGWNANIGSGLDRAARELGVDVVDVPWVVDPAVELRALAEAGPEIVISDALAISTDPIIVDDFPDVRFGLLEVSFDSPNTTVAMFANEEGAFLAGAAAAMTSQTGTVGFMGALPIPLIEEFRAGFEAGARAIDPDITVLATFVDPFDERPDAGFVDRQGGAVRARALYDRGADVVFSAAGYSGFGMFDAVVEASEAAGRHLWAIGVDNDQWYDLPPEQQSHVLTSVIKRGDVAAFRLVGHMLDGGPPGAALRLGLADDGFTYSQQGGALAPDSVAMLDRLVADIADGVIEVPVVPTGPTLLLDSSGNEIDEPADS
jgi:basic membrane protein A